MQMLLTGELIDATTARDWGLVNQVVAEADLDASVDELAARIAGASAVTVGLGKRAFYDQVDLSEPAAYDLARSVMSHNATLGDAQEGIAAFLGKRPPVWGSREPAQR